MSKIQELIEKRAKVWETAKNFLDTRDGDTLSATDDEQYTRMENEITDITKEIDRLTRAKEIDEMLSQPVNKPIVEKPENKEVKKGTANTAYTGAMLDWMRSGFKKVSNILEEGVDEHGGYLVPDEWDSRLIDVLEEENIFRKLGTKITTSGDHKINIAANKPAAAWIDEGEAISFGEATFDQIMLDAHKLHVAIKITEELLYDNAFGLESYIINQFGKAIGNAEEDAFLNGDGKGKPLGIFDKKGGGQIGVSVKGELKSDDILDLIYSLKRPYRKRASFIMNDSTIAQLRKLKDGNEAYMWQPSYREGEPDRLCGYAIHTSAYAPQIEAGKPAIAFGDFSYYNIGDRGTRSFQELRELFAGNGMIGYVAKERVDGKLVLPEAVKILDVTKSGGSGS